MRIRLGITLCLIGAVVVASWIICCANALAHECGNPVRHFKPCTRDDSLRFTNCGEDGDDGIFNYTDGHGHINNGGTTRSYWTAGGYEIVSTLPCDDEETEKVEPTNPPPPPPPKTTTTRTVVPRGDTRTENTETRPPTSEPEPSPEPPQNEGQSTPSRSTTSTDSTSDSTAEVETYVTFPSPDKPPPAPEKPIAEIIEEVSEVLETELVHFDYPLWRRGYNLVSFPVVEEGIETVADFYNRYPFLDGVLVYVLLEGVWYPYNGDDTDQIAGQVPIVPYLGVVLNLNYAHYLGVNGIQLEGDGSIDLKPGLNILGLSELPSRYQRPSDLLVPGVEWVMTRPSNSTPEGLSWHLISREGDSGDEYPLAVGEAILIFCSVEVTLNMTETAPAAPSTQQSKTLTTTWGAMKR